MTYQEIEHKIVKRLIADALKAGYLISVNDGENWVLKKEGDFQEILKAIRSTESDRLNLWEPMGDDEYSKVGQIILIYGNGVDVIHDWSDNAETNTLIDPILDITNKIEELNDI